MNVVHSNQKYSALDGYAVIDGDTATVMDDEGVVIQISTEEWETLREHLRFDDPVDYGRGETPMTGYQFRSFVELTRQTKELEARHERLKAALE
jgi:hypothetical protein